MNIEIANRYANLLTYIIDKKVRMEGRNVSLYKSDILFILKNNISERQEITEKIFKDTILWFNERNVFIIEEIESDMRYKLHPNFK